VTRRGWRPYAAPAAFLLAATIAVLVARSFMHDGNGAAPVRAPRTTTTVPTAAHRAPAPRPHLYTVRAGDTLTAIAARSGVPLARIRVLNPSLEPTALFIGEKIRLR
jgi:spore germination protein YaaH